MLNIIGISYTDIFPTETKLGGIHNFTGTKYEVGKGTCVWDADFNKISESLGPCKTPPSLDTAVIAYGDRVDLTLFDDFEPTMLAVDFADTFMRIPDLYIQFWRKKAHLLLFSISDDLLDHFPRLGVDVVAHAPKGVYYRIGDEEFKVMNEGYNPNWKNCIGAGDYLASYLLQGSINSATVDLAIKETTEFLRKKNELPL